MSGWTKKRCFFCGLIKTMPVLSMDCGHCEEKREQERPLFPKRKKQGAA